MSQTREEYNVKRRQRYSENKDEMRKKSKEYNLKHPGRSKKSREDRRFGGNKDKVLKRDGFKCQECGMTREEHFNIFKKDLDVHHKDGHGRNSKTPNHKMNNLITYCTSCHTREDRRMMMKRRWGDLVEQDDSDWKYPKIRYLVEAEIINGAGVQEAKRIVSENTGMSFTLIDHRYYNKKDDVSRSKDE